MLIRWRDNSGFPALPSMFDDFFNNDLSSFFGRDMSDFFNRNQNMMMPAVNIKETQDSFQIEVVAPGLNKEDFKLHLEHNVLTVSAQKESRSGYEPQAQSQVNQSSQAGTQENMMATDQTNSQNLDQSGNASNQNAAVSSTAPGQSQQPQRYTRREFSYTSFQRSFTLPETVEPEQIAASYQDGILYITVPKRVQQQTQTSRRIDIS